MITTDSLTLIRMLAFAIAGLICAAYAGAALLSAPPDVLLHWAPPIAGGITAGIVFVTSSLAGAQKADAAFDESYRADRRTAATAGFWSAITIGTLLWLTQTGGTLQLAITLTGSASVFLLMQAALDLRGLR